MCETFYQHIPNNVLFRDKTSQTVRLQKTKVSTKCHSDNHPSAVAMIDFLRVVQFATCADPDFLANEGREDLNATKSGSSLNDVSLVGRLWPTIKCWFDSYVIFQGFGTSIA